MIYVRVTPAGEIRYVIYDPRPRLTSLQRFIRALLRAI